jgi:hypothetical protein
MNQTTPMSTNPISNELRFAQRSRVGCIRSRVGKRPQYAGCGNGSLVSRRMS